jgi:predicted ATPase
LDVPLSLLLDDVQWIDGSSISVLNQILKTSQIKRLFFVASFRDEKENSFVEMVDGLHGWGMAPTKVKLDCLDGTAVNMLLSRMLCLAPRLVLSLSEIVFHKTSGSPFIHHGAYAIFDNERFTVCESHSPSMDVGRGKDTGNKFA